MDSEGTQSNHRDSMANDAGVQELMSLRQSIAQSMEELEQLHQLPTLDDFQEYWRKRLESGLLIMRQELRDLEDIEENWNPSTL